MPAWGSLIAMPWATVSLSCWHRQALPNILVPVLSVLSKHLQSHMHPTALHGQAMTNSLFLPQMYFNSIISDSTKLLKPILVFAFAIAAGICGLTQITQYRSHPADVYVGFLIGAGIAAYLVGAGPALGPGRGLGDAGGAV